MTTATLSDAGAIALSPLPDVLARVAAGEPVLVLDDADRENEADLIVAADRITPATMALLIREGSGIVCLCIRPD
jgi:3,4-dihydroxy 2-butanone 4-phosphate synthase